VAAHAVLGASSSDKWYNCAASPSMEKAYAPPEESKDYTNEGTACHSVGEQCLRGRDEGVKPDQFLGKMIPVNVGYPDETEILCTQEMVEAAEIYVNYVLSHGGTLFVEERVDYSKWVPGGFGTADALTESEEVCEDREGVTRPVNTLFVDDLKYGAGIMVSAYENKQGQCYGLGSLESLDFIFAKSIERIVIAIIQPRRDHISEYEIWVDDLLEWAETEVKPRAELAWDLLQKTTKKMEIDDEDGEHKALTHVKPEHYKPGKKTCQWCKAKEVCKFKAKKGYEAAVEGFEDLTEDEQLNILDVEVKADKKATKKKPAVKSTLRDPQALSNEELAKIYLEDWPVFKAWGEKLKDHILERAMKGEHFPGIKPVLANGSRGWSLEEAEVIAAMRTAGLKKVHYEKVSLISPTQAEAAIKELRPKDYKKRYEKLEELAVSVEPGNPTLAKENDKRESIAPIEDLGDVAESPDAEEINQDVEEFDFL